MTCHGWRSSNPAATIWYDEVRLTRHGESGQSNNSWDLGITFTDDDFQSLSDQGIDRGFLGPRKADGSLPDLDLPKVPVAAD